MSANAHNRAFNSARWTAERIEGLALTRGAAGVKRFQEIARKHERMLPI